MRRRILSAIAAIAVLCSILVGCGVQSEPEGGEDFSSVFVGTWELVSFEGSEEEVLSEEEVALMRVYGRPMLLTFAEDGTWSLGLVDGDGDLVGTWTAPSATSCEMAAGEERYEALLDPGTGCLTLSSGPTTMVFRQPVETADGIDPFDVFAGTWDLVAMTGPEEDIVSKDEIRLIELAGYHTFLDLREDGTWSFLFRDDEIGAGTWKPESPTLCILTVQGEDADALFDPLTGYLVYQAGRGAFFYMRDWDPRAEGAGEFADSFVGSWDFVELVDEDPESSMDVERVQDLRDLGYVTTLTLYGDGTYVLDFFDMGRRTGYWIATSPTEAMAAGSGSFAGISYDPDSGRLAFIEGSGATYFVRSTG